MIARVKTNSSRVIEESFIKRYYSVTRDWAEWTIIQSGAEWANEST